MRFRLAASYSFHWPRSPRYAAPLGGAPFSSCARYDSGMQPKRKRKHQQGSVWLRGSKFFLRYYGPDKKQRTEFLVARDERFHSARCKPVRDFAARAMTRVNAGA